VSNLGKQPNRYSINAAATQLRLWEQQKREVESKQGKSGWRERVADFWKIEREQVNKTGTQMVLLPNAGTGKQQLVRRSQRCVDDDPVRQWRKKIWENLHPSIVAT
jgi:hypothetical protein